MAADDAQDLAQRRALSPVFLMFRQTVQIEEPAPGVFLVGAAAGGPRPFQVRLVHGREAAVEPLQGERDFMEIRQRGQQQALVGQGFGGQNGRKAVRRGQREPAVGSQRYRIRGVAIVRTVCADIDQAHEQTRARRGRRRPRPCHAAPHRKRGPCRRRRLSGLHERVRRRPVHDVPGQRRGHIHNPRIDRGGQVLKATTVRRAGSGEVSLGKRPIARIVSSVRSQRCAISCISQRKCTHSVSLMN